MESSGKKRDEKKIKEEEKRQKEEEKEKKEKEISEKIAKIDNEFKSIKLKKDTLNENFLSSIKSILALSKKKVRNDKIIEDLYLTTAKMIEVSLAEKELADFVDKLNPEEKAEIVKFFYQTYDRFTRKLNCLTLKPAKIYNMHQTILAKEGVGIVSRAMFSIQK